MPLPKNAQNDKARIDCRRAKVAELYLAGKSQQAIAGVVGVSQMTVSKDLTRLRAEWRAAARRDFDARMAEELARLAQLERAAWEAWGRSRDGSEATSDVAEYNGAKSCSVPARRVRAGGTARRAGDPRFLDQIVKCIEARLELFGAFDPVPDVVRAAVNWHALGTGGTLATEEGDEQRNGMTRQN